MRGLARIEVESPVGGFTRLRLRGPDHQGWRVVDVYAHNLTDDPSISGILVSGGDITDHENSARAPTRALSDVTRILVHAKDEKTLMTDVCASIIENGEYLVAWVGYAEHDDAKTVRLVASSGQTEALLTDRTRWDESEFGHGADRRSDQNRLDSSRAGATRVGQAYEPWREQIDV